MSITAPGNVATAFEYDAFGRRPKLIDPSAGNRTTAYSHTGAGELVVTETDPEMKASTSVFDKYGRLTGLQFQGQGEPTTTYEYGADGLLANAISTNGITKLYTYDGYDRLLTEKETVPDGKWLQKTYAYSGGNLASVQYAAQSGTIATENHLYQNGHHTDTKPGRRNQHLEAGHRERARPAHGHHHRQHIPDIRVQCPRHAHGQDGRRPAGLRLQLRRADGKPDVPKGQYAQQNGGLRLRQPQPADQRGGQGGQLRRQRQHCPNGRRGRDGLRERNRPYQLTLLVPQGTAVPLRNQNVSYTSRQRPGYISELAMNATFAYGADGDRVKMEVRNGTAPVLTRHYIGGRYELDTAAGAVIERLYLGGDAYSAPAVYVRENGAWKVYYILRDHLGSITHVARADGTLKQELSYDAWGRLRDPVTHVAYAPDSEPVLFLGRGYTGHEHLAWFGLVNMNARLYDPALGRFLSPDPYVQLPDFSQNFNRYSYALNNPLLYVDPDGEFILPVLAAVFWGAVVGAGVSAVAYTVTAAVTGDWSWRGFGNAVGMGAIGGAIGGGFSAIGTSGLLGSFGNTFGYNMLSQSVGSLATTSMYGGEISFASVSGMVEGGLIGSVLPQFNAVKGAGLKNAALELSYSTGKGALTGATSGAVRGLMGDGDMNAIWKGAVGGAVGGFSNTLFNIGIMGPAMVFNDSYIPHGRDRPIHRSGGLADLLAGTGISLGRNAYRNNQREDRVAISIEESFHYLQQKQLGLPGSMAG